MKKLTVILGAVALVWGGAHLISEGDRAATVERIIDGDTLDASINQETVRIRLLNIDTPEIGRDGNPSECFAEDAKRRLEELVPPGTKVHLEYDQERLDKYGRTLAGVFRDDQFVNEQLASEGLARAIVIEPNSRFYQQILDAERDPRDSGLGKARLKMDARQRDLYYEDELTHLLDATEQQVRAVSKQVDDTEARVRAREAERRARELEEERRRLTEETRQREEELRQQQQSPPLRAPSRVATNPPPAPAVDNYTGCRAYGGNYVLSNVDNKGRRYAKIDCSTKVQIG